MNDYKVLITTSGLGSRLGNLTKFTNKSLLRVGKKPAISYVIEKYPKNIELVVTLGHFGNLVRDFLEMVYSDRKFTFVKVDPYKGPKSSLLFSMLCAKSKLQCPFILHVCDTITYDSIPEPNSNWCANFKKTEGVGEYRTHNISKDKLLRINDKGSYHFDCVHIGICGIKDYKEWWQSAKTLYDNNRDDMSLSDCHVINDMLDKKIDINPIQFSSWIDMGNIETLATARKTIKDEFHILDKDDESIFIFDDFVVKFFSDEKMVLNRVERSKLLKNVVPKIVDVKPNFYKYEYVKGNVFSETVDCIKFKKLLTWCQTNLWTELNVSDENYKRTKLFYFDKTMDRVNKFLKNNSIRDKAEIINGLFCYPIEFLLKDINEDQLCSTHACSFHGDLILDNIIEKEDGEFTLIDWRQEFAGSIKWGDIYYDLAKLNHNLIFNHDLINKGFYRIETDKDEIKCDIFRSHILKECQEVLYEFITANGFNLKKVLLLTPIIWLNMSALHEYPINKFLFYFGKYNLCKEVSAL